MKIETCIKNGASTYVKDLWDHQTILNTDIQFDQKNAFIAAHTKCGGVGQQNAQPTIEAAKKAFETSKDLESASRLLTPTSSKQCVIDGVTDYLKGLYTKHQEKQEIIKLYSSETDFLDPQEVIDLDTLPSSQMNEQPKDVFPSSFFQKAIEILSKKEVLIRLVATAVAVVAYRHIYAQKPKEQKKPMEPNITYFPPRNTRKPRFSCAIRH